MTLSFRSRLTLRWVLAFGLVLAAADLAVYFGARAFLHRDLDAQLRTLAATELASAVDEPGTGLHLHEFPTGGHNPQEFAGKFVQLIDAGGRVLMQSPLLGRAGSLIDATILARALSGDAPMIDVSVAGRAGRLIGLVTPGPERYVVAVGVFTDQLDATLVRLRNLLAGVWFAALALTAVIGFSLASTALVPIRRITHQAAAIADGKFARRLDPPSHDDEIGQMTQLLNRMLDRLHGALEANRRFAADASHELRGPLTAVLGEIDVTLKRDRRPVEYRESLARLRERLQVMSRLTGDLMLLVRAQENSLPMVGEVRVADLLQRVAARAAETAAAAGVSLSVTVPPDLVVYGDAGLLERVFDNLLINGIQYNRDGGTVSMTASISPREGEWVADRVVIAVRDTGTGIPAAERERVFERFYRVDSSRSRRTGGAGLGLAISREIVELFKGTIRVAGNSEPGATIEVGLPGGLATH
ncbi:MAG: sensor histidine kinase [Vicinamibacterales bacterium]